MKKQLVQHIVSFVGVCSPILVANALLILLVSDYDVRTALYMSFFMIVQVLGLIIASYKDWI